MAAGSASANHLAGKALSFDGAQDHDRPRIRTAARGPEMQRALAQGAPTKPAGAKP